MTTTARHQIIEASAGTGKTYTIENEVVRLIVAEGIPLTQILIVTFTEKATGELRRRVREKLEDEWRRQPDAPRAAELRASLDSFDDAPIYTIHGFCTRVLSEYAFETKLPFTLQNLDDPELWDRLFARSLRGYWRRNILTDDDPLRSRTAFTNKFFQGEVQKVAIKLMPGDELIPKADEPLINTAQAIATCFVTLEQTLGSVPDDVTQTPFITQLCALKMHGGTKKSLLTHYTGFLNMLQRYQHDGMVGAVLDSVISWKPSDTLMKNLPTLIEAGLLREEDKEAFSQILRLKNELDASIIAHAIRHLAASMQRYKREGGFIDFNDMLLLVQAALQPPSPLVNILRKRYAVALVDEFQDTDQVQWDIFRTLFAEDDTHRLIVVGDPKQAIYSFRGANVNVYLQACKDMCANDAKRRSLNTNWRSYPALINALNELFCAESSWFGESEIQHQAISAPDSTDVRARVYADASARRPLTLVQLPDALGGTKARIAFARFIANEIQHLLRSGIEIAEWRDAKPYRRALHPGDICILIRSRGELPALDRALRWAKIPYSFPKQGGLFAALEAQEWRYLLRAIAAPDDPHAVMTALLTRFFGCAPETLESYPTLPSTHPLKSTFARWQALAERRAWAPLFQAIFADTGVLARELRGDDGERIVTNHQHLAQLLHEQAVRTRGTLDELIAFLDLRCLRGGEEDADLQRVETERRKVQIMTMHSVNGLEFPVVFIAGGFTARPGSKGYPSYTTPQGRVYAFDKNEAASTRQKSEEDADSRRLYYVALTRAKFKLYVPRLVNPKPKESSLATFICAAMEKAWPLDTWQNDDRVAYLPVTEQGKVEAADDNWCATVDDATGVTATSAADQLPRIDETRIAPTDIDHAWGQRVTRVASYSALAGEYTPHVDIPVLNYAPSADMATSTPRQVDDDAADVRSADEIDDLPHGADTGTLLHAVLEEIDYPTVLASTDSEQLLADGTPTRELIDRLLERYPLRREGATAADRLNIARIVWKTLHTPMPFLEGTPIGALTDRRHEVEFWLPASGLRTVAVEDIRLEHTNLSGFIDLIFRHAGRYYVLDWKSNWSPSGDYSRATLDAIMRDHQYDLQYRIYQLALDRLLRLSLADYDPATHLGGVCYLFLRGEGVGCGCLRAGRQDEGEKLQADENLRYSFLHLLFSFFISLSPNRERMAHGILQRQVCIYINILTAQVIVNYNFSLSYPQAHAKIL